MNTLTVKYKLQHIHVVSYASVTSNTRRVRVVTNLFMTCRSYLTYKLLLMWEVLFKIAEGPV